MKLLSKILNKIKRKGRTKKLIVPFFTKDIFKESKFIIGEYTYGKPTVLFENNEANLNIGKFCSIADDVIIFLGGNHRTDWISTYPFNCLNEAFPEATEIIGHPASKGSVVIGNDVWIGRSVIIMSGVKIGDGAVIAAGSVVSKNIGDYEVWGGNPAQLLKKRFNKFEIEKLKELKWWDWDIDKIKEKVNYLCSDNLLEL